MVAQNGKVHKFSHLEKFSPFFVAKFTSIVLCKMQKCKKITNHEKNQYALI